jgi:DNA-binding phage protein
MKKELEKLIRIRIAISLRKLLENSKKFLQHDDDIAQSYNQIAIITGLRKGTVSDTFNAKSTPGSGTLILIVEAMGFNLMDFSKIYCSLNDSETSNFKELTD